tara:strand:- start:955 stop:1593 length:639 start_codon:yes stop_codon:yes gene_type:complete
MNNTFKMNLLGYFDDSCKDINKLLNDEALESSRQRIEYFFNKPLKKFTNEEFNRYVSSSQSMNNIGLGSANEYISEKLINPLASSKRVFCYGEFLASIELCALFAEMLAAFLIISSNEKHKLKNNQIDKLRITEKVKKLKKTKIITDTHEEIFLFLHEERRKFYHHWYHGHEQIEKAALNVLCKSSILASDLLDVIDKEENIKRVKQYLDNF